MSEAAPPKRRRQTSDGSTTLMRCVWKIPLVTSARFEKRNGRRREGDGATGSPCSEANRALVTARLQFVPTLDSMRSVVFALRSSVKFVPVPTACRLL